MEREINSLDLLILILFIFLNIISCNVKNDQGNNSYLKITDDLNRELEFKKKTTSIVSLAPNITEILFALDNGKSLAAVTDYCNYPIQAKIKPSIGGMINPNYEIITKIKPDLVIMTVQGNNQTDFTMLEKLGYKIFVSNPKNISGIFKSIADLGKIIDKEETASLLINQMKKRLNKIVQSSTTATPKNVFFILSLHPLISAGNDTFINEMINLLGCVNLAAGSIIEYPIINREVILKQNPDILIAVNDAVKSKEELLISFPEWKYLNAFKDNKVFIIEADLVSRPGPRVIDGLELLAKFLN